ncbi:MFS transporter [Puniceicoccaceae bacterium K14]|nr:MFS transporter [Puniceicoccaceae bacterium K14]
MTSDTQEKKPIPHARWNYWIHTLEGCFNVAGLAFIQVELVLPALFRSLDAPNIMIALSPILIMAGLMAPPLFTAHLVERLDYYKPVMNFFTVLHRIPYFIIAATLFYFGTSHPEAVLYITFLGLILIGASFGVVVVGWMEWASKTVEGNRLSSMMATRNIVGAIMGVFAGGAIKKILDSTESPQGYGILFLITGIFGVISFSIFIWVKEERTVKPKQLEEDQNRSSLMQTLKTAPTLFSKHPRMRKLLWSRLAYSGVFIVTPFMGIHAIDTTGQGDGFLGVLVTWQMVGSIIGNLFAGYWGDKLGPKTPSLVSCIAFLLFFAGMYFNTSVIGFQILFAFFGFAFYTNMASRLSLDLEVCGPERRPIFMSVMTFLTLISMLSASTLAALLRDLGSSSLKPAIILGTLLMTLSVFFLARIKNPRFAKS